MDAMILKKGVTYGITGLIFILVLGVITTFVGSQVGEGFKDISLTTLGQGISQFGDNPLLVLVVAFYFIVVGFLVLLIGKFVTPNIGKALGLEIDKDEITTNKKAYLVTFFLTGLVTVLIIGAFNDFLQEINPDVNIIDLGTLSNAITETNPMFWAVLIIGLIVLGLIVSFFGKYITSFRDAIPDKLAVV